MNDSKFLISGMERRELKRQLYMKQRFVKMFWHFEDVERVYGGGMDDDECEKMLTEKKKEIVELEDKLKQIKADGNELQKLRRNNKK
jgi:hypothetical protein